jgi:hypothetical protein
MPARVYGQTGRGKKQPMILGCASRATVKTGGSLRLVRRAQSRTAACAWDFRDGVKRKQPPALLQLAAETALTKPLR